MKKSLLFLTAVIFISACSQHIYQSEFEFANSLAKRGLWKEAHYRWQKCLDRGEKRASLYNNIAIYYEQSNDFEKARVAYQKALELAPGNEIIKSNFEKMKAFLERKAEKKNPKKETGKNETK